MMAFMNDPIGCHFSSLRRAWICWDSQYQLAGSQRILVRMPMRASRLGRERRQLAGESSHHEPADAAHDLTLICHIEL